MLFVVGATENAVERSNLRKTSSWRPALHSRCARGCLNSFKLTGWLSQGRGLSQLLGQRLNFSGAKQLWPGKACSCMKPMSLDGRPERFGHTSRRFSTGSARADGSRGLTHSLGAARPHCMSTMPKALPPAWPCARSITMTASILMTHHVPSTTTLLTSLNSTILLPCPLGRAYLQSLGLTDLSCESFTKQIGLYRPSSRVDFLTVSTLMQRIFVLPEIRQQQLASHVAGPRTPAAGHCWPKKD